MRATLVLGLLLLAPQAALSDDHFDLAPPANLDAGSHQGTVALVLDRTTLRRGATYDFKIRFSTTSGGRFFNPWLVEGLAMPGVLAMFDDHKRYLGDVFKFEGGARRMVSAADWLWIPADHEVGALFTRSAGILAQTEHYTPTTALPPGTYYLQLIVFKAFAAGVPADDRAVQAFYKSFDRSEYFRSNVVKIELTSN